MGACWYLDRVALAEPLDEPALHKSLDALETYPTALQATVQLFSRGGLGYNSRRKRTGCTGQVASGMAPATTEKQPGDWRGVSRTLERGPDH